MTNGSSRTGAAFGLALCVLWAPMALIMPHLPDLASAVKIERFYEAHTTLLKVVILLVSIGFVCFFGFLGALLDRLRTSPRATPWIWTAFASALMFMTALAVALGLAAACVLLVTSSSPQDIRTLHAAAFVAAAPVAPAGVAFFVSIAAISLGSSALPRWMSWTSLLAAVANLGALGGFFSSSGPLNSGNGIVGGIAGPIIAWVLWILLASYCLLAAPPASTPNIAAHAHRRAPRERPTSPRNR